MTNQTFIERQHRFCLFLHGIDERLVWFYIDHLAKYARRIFFTEEVS